MEKKNNNTNTVELKKFTLPNEIVIVKHIPRKKGLASNVEANHVISGGLLSTATRKFSVPLQRNGTIKNILTEEEKVFLENATGLNLSVYGDFWYNFKVSLYKDEGSNRFDLSNPMDYISIKILENLKHDIALNWADRNKDQSYQFVITREDEQMKEIKGKYDSKREAFILYGKFREDRELLLGFLKLLTNKTIASDSKLEWLQYKIEEYIDTMPSLFVNLINDSSLHTKLLLNKAIESKVVINKGNRYSTEDGLDLCNSGEVPTFDNAVKYLNNPKNQDVRAIIEAKIDKIK